MKKKLLSFVFRNCEGAFEFCRKKEGKVSPPVGFIDERQSCFKKMADYVDLMDVDENNMQVFYHLNGCRNFNL